MRKPIVLLAVLAMGLAGSSAMAGAVNEVPSCYKANKLDAPSAAPAREMLVLVDQTTVLDDKLQRSVLENVWGYLGPDSSYSVVSFSAFTQGRYTEVVATGVIEPPFPTQARDSTSVRLLKALDACMQGQLNWARKRATAVIKDTMASASADIAKSDILAALKDVSARVKASPAQDKVVLIVSDMLENSSVTSFYASNTRARVIDAGKELMAAEKAHLLGDFGAARVFVLGAGLIGPSAGGQATYRDPKTMNALRDFWQRYFEKSAARLEAFGQPALLQTIR